MRPPLIRKPQRTPLDRADERGVTIALVALAIFSIIAMAGLSIDVGTLYQASAEAQRAADAAALAAARTLSTSGLTGDPTNASYVWAAACTAASQVAQTVASQNLVGGAPPGTVNVTFTSGDQQSNCAAGSGTAVSFGVNPTVTVQVTQSNLPTYFARIWGRTGNSVSATATAEAFNPSNSGAFDVSGSIVPVQPRCVKPIIIPNQDPDNPSGCGPGKTQTPCNTFVTLTGANAGTITTGGIQTTSGGTGVIGESFNLIGDCSTSGGGCYWAINNPPQANGWPPIPTPNIDFLPGALPSSFVAVPSCATGSAFQEAVAGCDQTTQYQCGVNYPTGGATNPNAVDLSEPNLSGPTGDTATAAACLINQNNGQDVLDESVYPYQIKAGAGNPLNVSGSVITSSNSIVTLPIYDDTQYNTTSHMLFVNAPVTIVGFLQVFIQSVNTGNGSLAVTVLNIAACGNGVNSSTTPVFGSSPVPVRLITPP